MPLPCFDPELKWHTRELDFADKWGAFEWMYKNQLGRRNLTDEQRTMLIGKMYEARKNAQGGDRRTERGLGGRFTASGQNVQLRAKREVRDGTAGQITKKD